MCIIGDIHSYNKVSLIQTSILFATFLFVGCSQITPCNLTGVVFIYVFIAVHLVGKK